VLLASSPVVLHAVAPICPQDRSFESVGPRTGLFLGTAQALALQPGVSRSGVTITAPRLIGIAREGAAGAAVLLAIPIIAGAGLYKSVGVLQDGLQGYGPQFFWGFVASAVSGFVVIWFLLRYRPRHDFLLVMLR